MLDRQRGFAFAFAFAVVVVALVLAMGCEKQKSQGSITLFEDAEIDPVVRAEVARLEDAFLQELKTNTAAALGRWSPEARAAIPVEQLKDFSEPYFANVTFRRTHTVMARVRGGGRTKARVPIKSMPRLLIQWDRTDGDSLVSLFEAPAANEDLLLALRWRNASDGWQLHDLDMRSFRVGGKDAVGLLEMAEQQAERGAISAAGLVLLPLTKMILPDGWLGFDGLKARADRLNERVKNAVKPYPITVDAVAGSPRLWRLEGQVLEQRVAARLYYVTSLAIDDVEGIRREARAILGVLGRYLPDVFEASELFIFTAHAEPPTDSSKTYQTFGVVLEKKDAAPP